MPSTSNLFWVAYPILLFAFAYQIGLPAFVARSIPANRVFDAPWKTFATTHCYASVTTLDTSLPHAQCFSIFNGKFSRVFDDEDSQGSENLDQLPKGHVIPGLWDGHGHLVQYGESLDSVNIFGATSMKEVQRRLSEYHAERPEAGTQRQWLRGVGWDQANFNGQWPVSVSRSVYQL
jgi:predicted amidohydrolase YtcJ